MLGLLVVTHGRLADEMVDALRMVVGEVDAVEAVSLGWNDDVDEVRRRIEEALAKVDRGRGVLLLTDMFGGTPTNEALSLHEHGKVEIITGVNVPMLVKFTNLREELDLQQAAERIADQGREAIQVASQLLGTPSEAKDGAQS
jgi:PTS system mannose-specific IIA component